MFQAAGLFSRLSTLQSDSQCKLANAESARMNLETKLKEQERDLKSELTTKSFEVLVKTKETDNAKEQLVKLHEQAKVNIENLAFLDLEKRLVNLYLTKYSYYFLFILKSSKGGVQQVESRNRNQQG